MKKIFSFQNIIFAAIAVYLVFMLVNQQKTLDENKRRNEDIRAELAQAEQDLEEVIEEEAVADTDEYVEKRAREELGYVYDDEIVYIREG
jgi:cell division protein FtsB